MQASFEAAVPKSVVSPVAKDVSSLFTQAPVIGLENSGTTVWHTGLEPDPSPIKSFSSRSPVKTLHVYASVSYSYAVQSSYRHISKQASVVAIPVNAVTASTRSWASASAVTSSQAPS